MLPVALVRLGLEVAIKDVCVSLVMQGVEIEFQISFILKIDKNGQIEIAEEYSLKEMILPNNALFEICGDFYEKHDLID
ncbi:hypothetical protein J2X69_000086 [Algoriphagus sp. 4150]|uniref:hypothetical protein n=1 Tax=Algoriphagus sp. 4150 TaxID=2817756 RepID=UPI0028639612|nr:hypothetical protein [Algoriphagus sp. 4150]MDR7127758.1 hypothetical protein [Algoriphagus sp. 4150]